MMQVPDDELIRREEQKRWAALTPAARWKLFHETIAWAEQQRMVRRNTPARCHELERKKLARSA